MRSDFSLNSCYSSRIPFCTKLHCTPRLPIVIPFILFEFLNVSTLLRCLYFSEKKREVALFTLNTMMLYHLQSFLLVVREEIYTHTPPRV